MKRLVLWLRRGRGDMDTMNVMWNMGSDFQYESAEQWFINLDKIIRAVNKNGTVRAQYSTPSIYYKAKLKEGITFNTKTDDFLYDNTHRNGHVAWLQHLAVFAVSAVEKVYLLNVLLTPPFYV